MKMFILFFCLLITFGQAQASWNNPYIPKCSYAYKKDSFGLGMMAVFENKSLVFWGALFDQECFELGQDWAQQILPVNEKKECLDKYNSAKRMGIQFETKLAGDYCFNAGFDVGVALFHTSMRKQTSISLSENCLKLYKQGLRQSCDNLAPILESDRIASECYATGWNDGASFSDFPQICH